MPSTDAIGLQRPPRSIPLTLRVALLSNLGVLIGLLILSAGTFFSIVFLSSGNAVGDLRLWVSAEEGRGIVRGHEPTIFGSGESSRRRHGSTSRIYRVSYTFETTGGETVTGASFVTGRDAAARYAKSNGNGRVAAVEYVPSAPHINRLRNTRTSPFGPGALLVLLVPAAGFTIVAAGIAHARSMIQLLRDGEAANGTILKCRVLPTRRMSPTPDGPDRKVFFDRNDPKRMSFPESLPGRVQLSQQGELVVSGTAWRLIRLLGAVVILLATIAVGLVAARQVSVLS